jgi:hypothetical protein
MVSLTVKQSHDGDRKTFHVMTSTEPVEAMVQ